MKAVIGRARENRAAAEVELMSSTSHEVCELWNGQSIVRTLGRPEVKQLLWFEEVDDDDETFGLHTVDTADGVWVEPSSMGSLLRAGRAMAAN